MKVVLLAVLLVFAVWADSAQAQKALRLCGREFFRAVVYTCGGSRWRRVQSEDPVNGQYIFCLCLAVILTVYVRSEHNYLFKLLLLHIRQLLIITVTTTTEILVTV